ncbi:Rossmann-like and DUF2520 domain-containing protein [Marinigracilibium pacificum]|uniref:DUF2520 domain-containing protein n=1 Tax=Marinigracilibium pacificum TaxID=2729599 RepID=A0A848J9Q5_9BACT|nr:F420-dependent NADP oxidoreductase [Marinigracilibium pacificum]NMM49772.1 DUF2520 domain-containing protein [Marinigracilibium pacificum]
MFGNKYFNICIVGTGNVAQTLALTLEEKGHTVSAICSRQVERAQSITKSLYEAEPVTEPDFRTFDPDIVILAVKDDAIEEVAQSVVVPDDTIIVHTSGVRSFTELRPHSLIGVFYPLQTFIKNNPPHWNTTPILVESDNKEVVGKLIKLGKSIGGRVEEMSSEKRAKIHVAAVFASNFTNHMIRISKELAKKEKIDFELIKPLIRQSIDNGLTLGPEKAQTGPAKRGDLETLDKHFESLKFDEDIAEIYRLISQHILDTYTS